MPLLSCAPCVVTGKQIHQVTHSVSERKLCTLAVAGYRVTVLATYS